MTVQDTVYVKIILVYAKKITMELTVQINAVNGIVTIEVHVIQQKENVLASQVLLDITVKIKSVRITAVEKDIVKEHQEHVNVKMDMKVMTVQ